MRRWMQRRTVGKSSIVRRIRADDLGPGRFADEQAAHLDHENDRDCDEQGADREAAHAVPAAVAGDVGDDDAQERDREADEGGRVLEEHDGEVGALGVADELPPRLARGTDLVRLRDTGPERQASNTIDPSSTPIAQPALSISCGLGELLDALEDREHAAEAEQHERDDERVEVADGAVAERMLRVGRPVGRASSEQQQALVAGVGEGVDRLREHGARVRHDERDELHHCDTEVREERGDDRAPRLVRRRRRGFRLGLGRHYSMIPPRVIASTSRARSSCASVISLRARTTWRIDFPVRFDSLMTDAAVS